MSAKTREGFDDFFGFIKELADPWGEKKLTARGELYTVWRTLPPPPPPPNVLCGSTTLWSDFAILLRDAPFSDLRLRVCSTTTTHSEQQQQQQQQEFSTTSTQLTSDDILAHCIVLAAASPKCRCLISGQWSVKSVLADLILRVEEVETPTTKTKALLITFQPSVTRTALWCLLEFVYTGTTRIPDHDTATQIQILASKLQLNDLTQMCHNFLSGATNTANAALVTSARHSFIQQLREICSFSAKTPETDLVLKAEGSSIQFNSIRFPPLFRSEVIFSHSSFVLFRQNFLHP